MSAPNFKGYTRGKKLGHYVDPEGWSFKLGHTQKDKTVVIRYLSQNREKKLFGPKLPTLPEEFVLEMCFVLHV